MLKSGEKQKQLLIYLKSLSEEFFLLEHLNHTVSSRGFVWLLINLQKNRKSKMFKITLSVKKEVSFAWLSTDALKVRLKIIRLSRKLSATNFFPRGGNVLWMHQHAVQEHIHQISVFPVNDWSSRAQAGHLENISLERRGPFVGWGREGERGRETAEKWGFLALLRSLMNGSLKTESNFASLSETWLPGWHKVNVWVVWRIRRDVWRGWLRFVWIKKAVSG